ncbi:MAG: TRAP transporter large permease subunit, partial [Desulfobacterales bacterium]|nr:TRAP transporter large permease subunit [Desulfobacterales bacterium]
MAALIFLGLAFLACLGAPLFAVLLAVAMVGFHLQGIDLSVVAIEIYRLADMPLLLALPFFSVAGYIVGHSQTSRRLVRLTQVFLGWLPGGLAIVSLVA